MIASTEEWTSYRGKVKAPSIFTESGSNQTSDKYKHISTANIVLECRLHHKDRAAFQNDELHQRSGYWLTTLLPFYLENWMPAFAGMIANNIYSLRD